MKCKSCDMEVCSNGTYCGECTDYILNNSECPDCGKEKPIYLIRCDSCYEKSKEPKMKEFDLKPFEVKKPVSYYYKIWLRNNKSIMGAGALENFGIFSELKDAPLVISKAIDYMAGCPNYDSQYIQLELCEDILKSHKWTFEDIQVGWFFKSLNDLTYIKTSATEYRNWSADDGGIYISGFDEGDIKITNVYDCQELAKVLMIEKVIT